MVNKAKQYDDYNAYIKRAEYLIMRCKTGIKTRKGIVKMPEPIMLLIRRNNNIEIIEPTAYNQLANSKFKFETSYGDERTVELAPSHIHSIQYGEDTIKSYILHEDWSDCIPPKPIMESSRITNAIRSAMAADAKWKAEEKKATAKQIIAVAIIIAIIVGGFILYKLVVPPKPVVDAAVQTVVNKSAIVIGR